MMGGVNIDDENDEMAKKHTPGEAIDDALKAIVKIDSRLKTIESDISEIKSGLAKINSYGKLATEEGIKNAFLFFVENANEGFREHKASHDIGIKEGGKAYIKPRE